MGLYVNVYGSVVAKEEITPIQKDQIEDIKNGWGYEAFTVDDNIISFADSSFDGAEPFTDGIDDPLEELLNYAKRNGISLNGTFDISCGYDDYDKMLIEITDNEERFISKEIRTASTGCLLEELKRRGVLNEEIIGMLDYDEEENERE